MHQHISSISQRTKEVQVLADQKLFVLSVKPDLTTDYHDQYLESVISADEDDDGGENDDDDEDDAGDQNLKHLQSVLEAWRWWHKT